MESALQGRVVAVCGTIFLRFQASVQHHRASTPAQSLSAVLSWMLPAVWDGGISIINRYIWVCTMLDRVPVSQSKCRSNLPPRLCRKSLAGKKIDHVSHEHKSLGISADRRGPSASSFHRLDLRFNFRWPTGASFRPPHSTWAGRTKVLHHRNTCSAAVDANTDALGVLAMQARMSSMAELGNLFRHPQRARPGRHPFSLIRFVDLHVGALEAAKSQLEY